jgi:hypothetical protein
VNPLDVALISQRARINARLARVDSERATIAARRKNGYTGPLTRAELAAQTGTPASGRRKLNSVGNGHHGTK